jgi:uncharacterized membrane protein
MEHHRLNQATDVSELVATWIIIWILCVIKGYCFIRDDSCVYLRLTAQKRKNTAKH